MTYLWCLLPHTQLCKEEDSEPEGDRQGLEDGRLVGEDDNMESCENLLDDTEQQ